MYTSGVWIVKEGKEEEFKRRWQAGADATVLAVSGVKFMLFQDQENPRRFLSLGEGWRNVEQIEAARSSPEYQDSMSAIWRMLESGEVTTLRLTAEVS